MKYILRSAFLLVCILTSQNAFAQGAKFFLQTRTVNFPITTAGKTVEKAILLYNLDSTLSVHGHLTRPADSDFALLSLDTFSIPPLTVDTILIQFAPKNQGTFRDSIVLTHDGLTSYTKNPTIIRLSGSATAANDTTARITLSALGLNLRTVVDTFVERVFYIRNSSDTSIRRLYGSITSPTGPFTMKPDTTFDIAQGDTALFTVRFAPTTVGSYHDTLWISSNADSAHRLIPFILTGTAQSATVDTPKVAFSIKSITFDSLVVGSDTVLPVTISNAGTAALNVYVLGPKTPFMLDTSGVFTLPTGSHLTLHVGFAPSSAGSYADSIVIATNAPVPNSHVVIRLLAVAKPVVQQGVATERTLAQLRLTMAPNPSAGEAMLRFTLPEPGEARISIVDLRGIEVAGIPQTHWAGGDESVRLDLADLPPGTYVIRLVTASGTATQKLEIRR